MLMTKSLAAAYLMSLRQKFLFPVNAAGIKLCVGDIPTDEELETLTQSSARILDNVAAVINTTGLTSVLKDTAWPPQYIIQTMPTDPTAIVTKAGKISWCVFYNATSNIVVLGDVTKTNGSGLVTIDNVDVTVGSQILFTNLSIQTGR